MYPIFFKDFCPDQISNLHNYNTRNCLNIRQIETRREFRKQWLRYDIIQKIKHTPNIIHDKVQTHSFKGFSNYIKKYFITLYSSTCNNAQCYLCQNSNIYLLFLIYYNLKINICFICIYGYFILKLLFV